MSPEPSYDRLRGGLRHAADVPVDVERSLEVVLGRRQQRVRARRTGAVLAAAAAVVVLAVGLSAAVHGLRGDSVSLPPAAAPSLRGLLAVGRAGGVGVRRDRLPRTRSARSRWSR